MTQRSIQITGMLVAAVAAVAVLPGVCRADVRIQERSTSLDSTINRWIAIKGEKRAVVSRAQTKGVLYDAGARFGGYVEIARPDRDLIWQIDPQERTYREITDEQFRRILQKGVQAPRKAEDQPLRTLYNSQTTAIEVVPTGRQKRIAGYEAEQVMGRVVVGAQNLINGKQLRYTFDQEVWITKDPTLLKETQAFEEAYVDHFGSPVSLSQALTLAGEWNDAFVTHLRALNDRVRGLGGFILSSSTTVTEEAVAQDKNEKGSSRQLNVASTEVTKISTETVPDTEFELPAGYLNEDTKVAVASPAAPAPVAPAPMPAVAKADLPASAPAAVKPTRNAAAPGVVASANGVQAPAATGEAIDKPRPDPMPVASAAKTPAAPDALVGAPSSAPSNVIVKGGPVPAPVPAPAAPAPPQKPVKAASSRTDKPAAAPAPSTPTIVLNAAPYIPQGIAESSYVPAPVVVDEPEAATVKKKKKRK